MNDNRDAITAPSRASKHLSGSDIEALAKLGALGVRHPVMQAGMTSASGPALAGAVSAAGGIGTLGLHDVSVWEEMIERTRARAKGNPISVNLLLPYTRVKHLDVVIRQQVPIVTLFWGDGKREIRQLRKHGVFVFQQVGSVVEARKAIDAGVDGIIVQGVEAGGHVRAEKRLDVLLPEVVELTSTLPVFAAGGIYAAEDAARVVGLGAHGVCTGTRFLLTPESHIHDAYREALLAADNTILTHLFGFGWPDLHRVVPNKATERWCRENGSIPGWLKMLNTSFSFTRKLVPMKSRISSIQKPSVPFFSPAMLGRGQQESLIDATAIYAGEQVGRIHDIKPASEIVAELAKGMVFRHEQ
ncbi:2-nitropropane dioxygenase [Alcanivorax xiamenensis]|uniref:2-nitropropane dioxygenase n=1 Tax=Alcanivorax xiamenensis TaxID=1177156 RepID=A0ABQ6Y567_9GAMM|nr:nitronate monooxygenase [Alcanivorax xiamenensis]KAF0804338.1 2-nitropropane dioxygenase [Alcanivorax xiamenensis]